MVPLARRTLFHDKVRFAVTLTGIVFAIVLIVVQMGLFLGFTLTTSGLIDHSGADIWVASKGVPFLEVGVPFPERKIYQIMSLPGVAEAGKMIVRLGNWKRGDGAEQGIVIVGFEATRPLGGPWDIVEGDRRSLQARDAVMIDMLYRSKLGVSGLGSHAEISGTRARVVGFTKRIRSFTTSPYVFTSMENARRYARIDDDEIVYALVKAKPGADIGKLKSEIQKAVRGLDVYTTQEFSDRTRTYWMFTTGAGFAILIAALMGLVVGVVVVSQTIYATTMDHIREYGTLKAIGASNRYIYGVLIRQAVWSAVLGYAAGIVASYLVVWWSLDGGVSIHVPWQMAAAMLVLTVVMCVAASIISVNKVTRLDPGMVFK
jgi:putative ABC transport system permease protein